MYSFIWRHLPFRRGYLKALSSLVLLVGVSALLWYVIFPAVDPLLPFDDGQIDNSNGTPANGGENQVTTSQSPTAIPSISPTPSAVVEMPK